MGLSVTQVSKGHGKGENNRVFYIPSTMRTSISGRIPGSWEPFNEAGLKSPPIELLALLLCRLLIVEPRVPGDTGGVGPSCGVPSCKSTFSVMEVPCE